MVCFALLILLSGTVNAQNRRRHRRQAVNVEAPATDQPVDRWDTVEQCLAAEPGTFVYYEPKVTAKAPRHGIPTHLKQDWCVWEAITPTHKWIRWAKGTMKDFDAAGKPAADPRCTNDAGDKEGQPVPEGPAPPTTPMCLNHPERSIASAKADGWIVDDAAQTCDKPKPPPAPESCANEPGLTIAVAKKLGLKIDANNVCSIPAPPVCDKCVITDVKIRTYATKSARFFGGLKDLGISEVIAIPLGAILSTSGNRGKSALISAGGTLLLNRGVQFVRPSDNRGEVTINYRDGHSVTLDTELEKGDSVSLEIAEYPGAQVVWVKNQIYTTGLPDECGKYSAKPRVTHNITPVPVPIRTKTRTVVANKPPVVIITPHGTSPRSSSTTPSGTVLTTIH